MWKQFPGGWVALRSIFSLYKIPEWPVHIASAAFIVHQSSWSWLIIEAKATSPVKRQQMAVVSEGFDMAWYRMFFFVTCTLAHEVVETSILISGATSSKFSGNKGQLNSREVGLHNESTTHDQNILSMLKHAKNPNMKPAGNGWDLQHDDRVLADEWQVGLSTTLMVTDHVTSMYQDHLEVENGKRNISPS